MHQIFANCRFGVWKLLVLGTSIAMVLWLMQPVPEYQFAVLIDSHKPRIRQSSTTKPNRILSTFLPWKQSPKISDLEIDFGFAHHEQILPKLHRLPHLKRLELGLNSLEHLKYLTKHNGIEELTISCGQFTGDSLKHIPRLRLTRLCLSNSDELSGFRKTNRLDPTTLKYLSPMPTLKMFRLLASNSNIDLGDIDLDRISPNLESFEVSANSLTATKPFSSHSLTELSIRCDVLVTQEIVANLRLNSLRKCSLSVEQLEPLSLDFLKNHVYISDLTIYRCKDIDRVHIQRISSLKSLKSLELWYLDVELLQLLEVPSLETLVIKADNVSIESISEFEFGRFPKLQNIRIYNDIGLLVWYKRIDRTLEEGPLNNNDLND